MKYVIIGGVAGGATAAARIRRADEFAEIIVLEKGKYISYANCGLPYYIGGTIVERDKLFLQTPASFGKRFKVDVRVENEVIAIDTAARCVKACRADGSIYTENYDKLLLSPGASPAKPHLEGIDLEGLFTLRNIEDTDSIKNYIISRGVGSAVVVGAGFIGLEMAENLHHTGAEVSIVEMGNQVMAPVDFSIASHLHQHLLQKGVKLYLEQSVERFEKQGDEIKVFFKSGKSIITDIVILSIGVRPETKLAKATGLKIGETGGIWVNEYLETSAKNIYAVGDAVEFPHPLTGKPWLNYLANPANRQGRIVADNMVCGNTVKYEGAIGTSIAKVFDMTVAATGLAAKHLRQPGIEYASSTTHSASHAGYYPGALPLTIKLTFDPVSGKLYGGQCVGYEGVDKRIDQIALLIKNGGTIHDLMRVEHCYAPPFSSAKDPITIAGYVASNIISGTMPVITWRQIQEAKNSDVLLLDVRTVEENAFGAIPGSINIPLDELRSRIDDLPKDKAIYTYCAIGLRGYLALKILNAYGFKNVKNLSGGYKSYSTAIAPITDITTACSTGNKIELNTQNMDKQTKTIKIDACGLQCPGPIMKIKQAIDSINEGERVEMIATDTGFSRDAQAWCNTTGNLLILSNEERGRYTVVIEKCHTKSCNPDSCDVKAKTLIMFSDDLDKALATFVLANGAAATGQKVSIFFTFWGLNVIKKIAKPKVKKDIFSKMFGMMLPSSSRKLSLSKMSMFGVGDRMMRYIMKRKGIDSLESLRQQALDNDVEFIACQMSMDVMGVKREELLDEVTIGGVATYMERAESANVNLFI
ncbi:MAG: FAD-dependent oxidoreductase [Prevotellaceae bacterium]|jgi:NADPH-dependent 2,4-dienoyl-CoA reductase/sulfur reductase-like enzyme/peroxiredoxin family protein/rhodanese-related sulfurtransferase/TusA-related sulfurtransferase|nr:FAD-dependent oxidoreductase [Prevotellaceae bacterium]